jgi:hypothetical protein
LLRHRRAAWLIALPVATASWLNAHCLAYVLAPPDPTGSMHQHQMEQGHAYFASLPVFVAAGLTLLAAGLVLCVGEGLRGGPSRSQPPARLFALLLPLGFAVQEHLESLIASGSVPYDLAAEPTFLAGLVLQLPFALGALLLTRALYALGYGLGRLLARALPAARASSRLLLPVTRLAAPAALVPVAVLAPGHGPRAPPAAA